MKDLIFIDTNSYLSFYQEKNTEFKKLLKSLKEIKEHIFIPKQIIYEVERNKYKLMDGSFGNIKNQSTSCS